MPYKDIAQRRACDRRRYLTHRLAILLRKKVHLDGLPIGVNRRLHAYPDRRQNKEGARALGWALALHRERWAA